MLTQEVQRTEGRLYLLKLSIVDHCLITTEDSAEDWLWHSRLGHLSFHKLKEMSRKKTVDGLPTVNVPNKLCASCIAGKHHRKPFPKSSTFRASEPLELIHMDICGPISPPTLGGSRYFLLIIDDYSRLTWVAMLQCKSDAFEAFKRFKNLAETEKGVKVKTLRSDRGGEFTSEEFSKLCIEYGIKRQLTTPYSPQQNGVVERKNRTVMSMVRAMLKAKDLPRELWGEAVSTAIYILNRFSTKVLQGKTPHEVWTGKRPSVDHLRVFGSLVHVKNTKGHLTKLEDRSQPMVFIGYELGTKGYKCFDPVNFKVTISRDVIFEEGEKWTWSTQEEGTNLFTFLPNFLSDQHVEEDITSDEEDNSPPDEVTSSSNSSEDSHCPRYRSFTDLYSETNPIPLDEQTCLVFDEEPLTYLEAAQDEVWRKAMKEEMMAIDRSHTWELESPPSNCKPIGLKWIFKLKKNPKGEIIRHKARLVVKGYSQKKGIDYEEVFAPVVRFETIRALIALAAQKKWMIHHLDVKSAFLNGEIEEVIYVQQPEGFSSKGKEGYVLRLKKALYDLKQAPRAWYFKLHQCLISLGFARSSYEQSLYLKQAGMDTLTVGVYVDDLIITGSCTEAIEIFKEEMKKRFEMSDLGSLSSYLGLEVRQGEDYIFLS